MPVVLGYQIECGSMPVLLAAGSGEIRGIVFGADHDLAAGLEGEEVREVHHERRVAPSCEQARAPSIHTVAV